MSKFTPFIYNKKMDEKFVYATEGWAKPNPWAKYTLKQLKEISESGILPDWEERGALQEEITYRLYTQRISKTVRWCGPTHTFEPDGKFATLPPCENIHIEKVSQEEPDKQV